MAHETPTVTALTRDRTGSRYAQRVRKNGRLPAVVYGHQKETVHVSVDHKEMLRHLRHGAHVLNLDIEGSGSETCLVKDLQFGYLGDEIIHVDFARVDLDEEVTVNVHLHFVGESEAARQPGSILSHDITELEVICKVNAIPEEIRVDLSKMEGHILTVDAIQLPPGLTTPLDPTTPVAHVSYVHGEAEAEEAELETETAPEVITESKKEEAEG